MGPEQIKALLEAKLTNTDVIVEGGGCNFQLILVSDEFAGLSPVKKQQMVYAHLNHLIADGTIHAVTMKFFSPAEWQQYLQQNGQQ